MPETQAQSQSENPLIKALPPETDYISYLTILEYNVNKDQLPTLHDILQDTTLTSNIGWDLVHLLLPLVPHSKLCLQDVARLGNPREVVLKVTELLETLGTPDVDDEDGDQEFLDEDDEIEEGGDDPGDKKAQQSNALPSKELQFCVLLEMLQVLLPRIKTRFPSRFLSTSLQAILPAYAQVAAESQATEAVIAFIKALSGTSRPKLPPRAGSTAISINEDPQSAPDPEANDGSINSEEVSLQKRLLQAFLTFIVEAYMTFLPPHDDVPGMVWCSRIHEHQRPDSVIPGRRTFNSLFASEEGPFHSRDTIIGQLTAISRDLSLTPSDLLTTLVAPPSPPSSPTDLPSTTSEVPLSLPGILYLLVASHVATTLFNAPSALPSIHLFPHYALIVEYLIGTSSPSSAGTEPLALIDAVLALYSCLDPSDTLPESETFNEVVQKVALLSANTPNASLRYQAHLVTKNILASHPDKAVRLAYIEDTLKDCPYENLKASAVGWLKDEILADNRVPATGGKLAENAAVDDTPQTLTKLKAYLFLDPTSLTRGEDFSPFLAHQSFFLAVLNLMYLILSSEGLHARDGELLTDLKTWLGKLRSVAKDIRTITNSVHGDGEDAIPGLEMDLSLLEGNMDLVESRLE